MGRVANGVVKAVFLQVATGSKGGHALAAGTTSHESSRTKRSLMLRQLITVSTFTAIAQVAGFIKLWLTARLFGVGPELDGYFLALVAPTFFSGTLSSMLQSALFPVRARLAAGQDGVVVERFERGVLGGLFVLGLAIAVVILLVGPSLLAKGSSSVAPSVLDAARFVYPFAALLVPVNAVGDGLGYLLAMRGRYPVAAAAPIANALLGAGLLVAWPDGGLLNLALGTVAGLVLQVTICAWALSRTGFRLFFASTSLTGLGQEWQEMMRLSAWIFPGVVFSNLSATLPTVLIASYGEGAVSAFGYAWRLHQYAIQLVVMASSPILLARFAQLVASGDEAALRALLRKAVWSSFVIGLVSLIFVSWIGEALLRLVFSGRFDADSAAQVGGQWLWLTLALGPAVLGNVFAKVWQARRLARLLSVLSGLGLASFLALYAALAPSLTVYSVAAAVGIASFIVPATGWRFAWGNVPHSYSSRS